MRVCFIYVILAKEYMQSSIHLGQRLPLVTRNRHLSYYHFSAFSVYGKIQEAGFISIFVDISLPKGPVFPSTQCLNLFFYPEFLSGSAIAAANDLILVELDGEQYSLFYT